MRSSLSFALHVVLLSILVHSCGDELGENCGTPLASTVGTMEGEVGVIVVLTCSSILPGAESFSHCMEEQERILFQWEQESGPEVDITNHDQQEASFIPQEIGTYGFCCTATCVKFT